jgi:hypothetical protein
MNLRSIQLKMNAENTVRSLTNGTIPRDSGKKVNIFDVYIQNTGGNF